MLVLWLRCGGQYPFEILLLLLSRTDYCDYNTIMQILIYFKISWYFNTKSIYYLKPNTVVFNLLIRFHEVKCPGKEITEATNWGWQNLSQLVALSEPDIHEAPEQWLLSIHNESKIWIIKPYGLFLCFSSVESQYDIFHILWTWVIGN